MIKRPWYFRLAGAGGLVAGLLFAVSTKAADLVVEVRGLGSDLGQVHFGLYDDPKTFPDDEGRIEGAQAPVGNGPVEVVFKGLKPGFYAVAVYHDENENGEFDQGIFGIPLEDFGFSNDAVAFLGAPTFEKARVFVPQEGTRIVISVD